MSDIDLIPSDYRHTLRVKKLVKYFIILLVTVIVVSSVGRVAISQLIKQKEINIQNLKIEQKENLDQKNILENLNNKKIELSNRANAFKSLNTGASINNLLIAIDRSINNKVWLTELKYINATEKKEEKNITRQTGYFIVLADNELTDNQQNNKVIHVYSRSEITGQALSHTDLSEFLNALIKQPQIDSVQVLNTSTRKYTRTEVVDFNLYVLLRNEDLS
ncbi:MAG: PilN domain-containing protein [Gammaproteobacteria bacterium]